MFVLELLAVGMLGLLIGAKIGPSLKKQRKAAMAANVKLPFDLGLKKDSEYSAFLNNLRISLESSLDSAYLERVKKRVLKKNQWSDQEYDVYLYGVKQFFLLSAVLKSVPMFSKEVDEIWHGMLMFTREYQTFCDHFIGEMIHHEPTISQEKIETGALRAEFDWLYSQFFEVNEASRFIYKGFCRFKLDENRMNEFEKMTVEEIQSVFFKQNKAIESISKAISRNLKMQTEQAKMQKETKVSKIRNTNDDNMIFSLFPDYPEENSHGSNSNHHSGSHHHSCSSHSCSSHSCSSCSSCSSCGSS